MAEEGEQNSLKTPEWLDKDFIEDALQKGGKFPPDVKVLECELTPATGAGDNYCSCMFRGKLRLQTDGADSERKVIIKTLPIAEMMQEIVVENDFFGREAEMLSNIIPKLSDILREGGMSVKLAAELFYEQKSPDVIIMEDLCEAGFKGGDRMQGLDLEHCSLVLRSLARFHAASLVLLKREPGLQKWRNMWGKNENNEEKIRLLWNNALRIVIENIDSWTKESYAGKLEPLRDSFVDQVFTAVETSAGEICVVNHGDLWTNNIMFRYDESTLTGMIFVDLQMSAYSSLVLDLLYFIFTSPQNEIRIKYLDYFLETYHTKFQDTLKALGVEVEYSLDDLKQEFLRRLVFGFAMCISEFPVTIAPPADTINHDDEITASSRENIYKNKQFIDGFLLCLPFFEKNGVF